MFDFIDDKQKKLLRSIEREFHVPDICKQASLNTNRDSKEIFAWEEERKFPMDTPEDLYLSYLYFQKTAHNIPEHIRDEIEKNFHDYAEMLGFSLELKPKTANVVETPAKSYFSVRVPINDIKDSRIIQKFASCIQGDEIVMYPMDTEEDVRLANMYFPMALDGPFEVFRCKVARDIADRLDESALSQKVRDYLPLPPAVVQDQIEIRKRLAPAFAPHYEKAASLVQGRVNTNKLASFIQMLDMLDKQANIEEDFGIMSPAEFVRGIAPTTTITVIGIGRDYPEDECEIPVLGVGMNYIGPRLDTSPLGVATEFITTDDILLSGAGDYIPDYENIRFNPRQVAQKVASLPFELQRHIAEMIKRRMR
jgi:hypothetical protein